MIKNAAAQREPLYGRIIESRRSPYAPGAGKDLLPLRTAMTRLELFDLLLTAAALLLSIVAIILSTRSEEGRFFR